MCGLQPALQFDRKYNIRQFALAVFVYLSHKFISFQADGTGRFMLADTIFIVFTTCGIAILADSMQFCILTIFGAI